MGRRDTPACPSLWDTEAGGSPQIQGLPRLPDPLACISYISAPTRLPLTSPSLQSPGDSLKRSKASMNLSGCILSHTQTAASKKTGSPPGHVASSDFCVASFRSVSLLPNQVPANLSWSDSQQAAVTLGQHTSNAGPCELRPQALLKVGLLVSQGGWGRE